MKRMTLTECAEYQSQMYIKAGLLTPEKWKEIKRDNSVVALGIITLVLIIPVALLISVFI